MTLRLSYRSALGLCLALISGCSAEAFSTGSTTQPTANDNASTGDSGSPGAGGGNEPGPVGSTGGAGATGGAGSTGDVGGAGSTGGVGATGGSAGAGTGVSDGCYSPTQNLETAYDVGAEGCPCVEGAEGQCIGSVALICEQGFWSAVEDGPCEPGPDLCAPQDVTIVGGCEPAPTYHWNGEACVGQSGCSCEGTDCSATFSSEADCEAAFSQCLQQGEGCGGFLGDTCDDDEYCAYEPGQHCGAADASASCKPRPAICTKEYNPVCGCDSVTYANACDANAAGVGVLSLGECETQ